MKNNTESLNVSEAGDVEQAAEVNETPRVLAGLQEGRTVNYVMSDGAIRPMIIVNAWDRTGLVNGVLLFDGRNDTGNIPAHMPELNAGIPICAGWVTSAAYNETKAPGSWHWPDGVAVMAASVDANAIDVMVQARVEQALDEFVASRLYSKQAEFMSSVNEKLAAQTQAVNKLLDEHSNTVLELCSPSAPSQTPGPDENPAPEPETTKTPETAS